jgi:glycosyltransferase involved in cell wall biosynthesis
MIRRRTINSTKPLVSIGMPAYNGERYIRRALDSLLTQDYKNFELIISDNASTDATLQICNEYATRDSRISIHTYSHNVGALANFKTVLEMSRGKYFMWAAVDDYWQPEFIRVLVKELELYPESGVAMCAVDRVWENGEIFDTIRFINKDNPNHRSYYQMLKSLTSYKKYNLYIYGLFRTHLLRRAMFWPEVPGSDRLFMCQMALATRFRYVDRVLHIRMHHIQPSNVRLPNEKFNKMQNEDKLVGVKILFALGRMIYCSDIIHWYRKIYLPLALWRYGWLLLLNRFAVKIKERVNPHTWDRLKMIKKLIFPS